MLASSLTYPISGIVGDAYYRGRIVLWSLVGIAVTTVMVALSQTYTEVIVAKILNGISIGMLVPSLQALVGDMHVQADRGKAFGYLNFTGITGSIAGGTLATILAAGVYWGMDGWRLAFLIWTAYLILIIIGLWMFAAEGLDEVDAKKGEKLAEIAHKPWQDQLGQQAGEAWAKVSAVLSVPTLQVIIIPQAIGLVAKLLASAWSCAHACIVWICVCVFVFVCVFMCVCSCTRREMMAKDRRRGGEGARIMTSWRGREC